MDLILRVFWHSLSLAQLYVFSHLTHQALQKQNQIQVPASLFVHLGKKALKKGLNSLNSFRYVDLMTWRTKPVDLFWIILYNQD